MMELFGSLSVIRVVERVYLGLGFDLLVVTQIVSARQLISVELIDA